jgi:hypothetical protein
MRALAILADTPAFEHAALKAHYKGVTRRTVNVDADTLAFDCLLMALHNASSVVALSSVGSPYEYVRSGIVSWYYAVYWAAKAMIAAASGGEPQTHSKAAVIWQDDIAQRGLAVAPFDYCITDLTSAKVKAALSTLRGANGHDLNTSPTDAAMAYGAVISYLSGTIGYCQWEAEERVRESREYRALGVSEFRTKAAKVLRDATLAREKVCFLTQAFRYRGKANYRDSIYLSYGSDRTPAVAQFIDDLAIVAERFTRMACHYVAKRTQKGTWADFVADVTANARFVIPVELSKV